MEAFSATMMTWLTIRANSSFLRCISRLCVINTFMSSCQRSKVRIRPSRLLMVSCEASQFSSTRAMLCEFCELSWASTCSVSRWVCARRASLSRRWASSSCRWASIWRCCSCRVCSTLRLRISTCSRSTMRFMRVFWRLSNQASGTPADKAPSTIKRMALNIMKHFPCNKTCLRDLRIVACQRCAEQWRGSKFRHRIGDIDAVHFYRDVLGQQHIDLEQTEIRAFGMVEELDLDAPLFPRDKVQHRIHADTAARHVSDFAACGKSGTHDQIGQFGVRHDLVGADQALFDAGLAHPRQRQAATVVGQRQVQHVVHHAQLQADGAGFRLAQGDAFLRQFETVVHGVADQVHEDVVEQG